MFKSLKNFGKRCKCVSLIKSKLANQSDIKASIFERVHTIQSIDEFNEKIINSDSPVIVSFSAAWCYNCTVLSPIVESIVRENSKKVILFKVDVDKYSDLALEYKVSSIPVLFGVNHGQIQSSLMGLHETKVIRDWVDVFLNKT